METRVEKYQNYYLKKSLESLSCKNTNGINNDFLTDIYNLIYDGNTTYDIFIKRHNIKDNVLKKLNEYRWNRESVEKYLGNFDILQNEIIEIANNNNIDAIWQKKINEVKKIFEKYKIQI